jgi:hypothetical protein
VSTAVVAVAKASTVGALAVAVVAVPGARLNKYRPAVDSNRSAPIPEDSYKSG